MMHLDIQLISDTNALKEVLGELIGITNEWRYLGLALGLKKPTLDAIKVDNADVKDRMLEMVTSWLQKKDESLPSWQALVKALRDPLVNRTDIANTINDKF